MTNYASEEKVTAAETPMSNAMSRIDKVIHRLNNMNGFIITTLDRLIGERPRDPAKLMETDRPAGEYFGLIDMIDRLELATTALESEQDRLHSL